MRRVYPNAKQRTKRDTYRKIERESQVKSKKHLFHSLRVKRVVTRLAAKESTVPMPAAAVGFRGVPIQIRITGF
jgi:hypothetical protein